MRASKYTDFNKRRDAAATAKQALLERFKSRPGPDDPEVAQRVAERTQIAEARAAREAEKKAARLAEQKAREAEAALQAAKLAAEKRALEAAQKAERDRRYAARKARQR